MASPRSVNGINLARAYWSRVVRPVLAEHRPAVPRAAARIGSGSDVLGLDDQMSRDHDWGLRLQIFVPESEKADILTVLHDHLPDEFAGLPTRLAFTGQDKHTVAVDVHRVDELVSTKLGFDPRIGATPLDWLSLTGQAALEMTAGAVFEDSDDELTSLRQALAWYPDDVWRHVVAWDWQRIDQELPPMGRAADRGDELGSRLIAARLVDITMHLAFVLSRRWAPYPKWRDTMFRSLSLPTDLGHALHDVLTANNRHGRSDRLVAALTELATIQRATGLPSADPACFPSGIVHTSRSIKNSYHDCSTASPIQPYAPYLLGSAASRSAPTMSTCWCTPISGARPFLMVHPPRRAGSSSGHAPDPPQAAHVPVMDSQPGMPPIWGNRR